MANETQIGSLVIDFKLKIDALERGISTAQRRIQELEESNKSLENSNKSVDLSFVALATSIAASLLKVKGIINDSIKEYNEYTQAMSGLKDVADYTGNSMDEFGDIMQDFSKYMNKADIAATIKNFSLMGMTTKQTRQMMESLTNSAIKNRNANYTVSEAVKVASDGYKQGLSTLSDSAGVTENLSVMLDRYAQSIGKTASQLTEEEINQAYVNRTMAAAAPFAQAMTEYSETLAAKQGDLNKALKETQVAYATALEPTYSAILKQLTGTTTALGEFISKHEELVAGSTAFVVTLGILVLAITAAKKAYDAYAKSAIAATIAQKGFNAAVSANPIGLAIGVITTATAAAAAYGAVCETNQAKEEELALTQAKYNKVMQGTIDINNSNIQYMQGVKQQIEDFTEAYKDWQHESGSTQELLANKNIYLELGLSIDNFNEAVTRSVEVRDAAYQKEEKLAEELAKTLGMDKQKVKNLKELDKVYKNYCKQLDEAESLANIKDATDIETMKTEQKKAAQIKADAVQMQQYLNVVKQGNKNTSEYQTAVKQLAKAYPEVASAEGIIVEKAQDFIDAENLKADQAWNASQTTIEGNIQTIQTFMELANAAQNDADMQSKLAQALGVEYSQIIPTLTSVLSILQQIGAYQPTDVPGVTPTVTGGGVRKSSGGGGGSKSNENKALDDYKKMIAHKKAMDEISLKEEIDMYETALREYAKTVDEKNELREKIYDLNKELAKKEKDLLDEQTEDYEAYIQKQKDLRGAAYDVKEQQQDYDQIIRIHKSYLNQIMKDERLSLDERKEIYREELQTIRDYEAQKRALRVESVDNTVSQLTAAITKQLEELHEKDKELIDKNIEAVEKWKKARIDAINEEYDTRIEAIERELELLDQSEKEKTRAEEDAEFERKKLRLQGLIDFEHDATTKANYQKELDRLIEEYQKKLDDRALQDRRDALNQQKELLEEEQDAQIEATEQAADEQREIYDKQLDELEEYYDKQINMAQESAEKMLLNVESNQDKILKLLKNYGDQYEITGQSLGEKLAQGINEGLSNTIENIIQRVQDTIDSGLESKIREWTASGYNYSTGTNKPNGGINVIQNNYIQQTPEMPSETYRKLKNIDEQLAAELAGL